MNARPPRGSDASATSAIGYAATTLTVVGDGHAVGVVAGREHVGAVHEPGVRLAEEHLGGDGLHVLFQRRRHHRDPGVREHLICVGPAGDLGRALHDDEVVVREIGDTRDAARVAGLDDDLGDVGGEHLRLAVDEVGVGEHRHVGEVGRREHVGGRALAELRDQLRRAGEAEGDLGAGSGGGERVAELGERGGQRRRCEHGDVGRRCVVAGERRPIHTTRSPARPRVRRSGFRDASGRD